MVSALGLQMPNILPFGDDALSRIRGLLMHVLVIDDDVVSGTTTRVQLQTIGYRVSVMSDPELALEPGPCLA